MLRKVAGQYGGLPRLRDCGRKSVSAGGAVALRGQQGDVAGFAGLETCGSVWACPVCAAKIGAHRASELAKVITWARTNGHTVALLTLTARHHAGEPLRRVMDRITSGWECVTSGWASETAAAYERRKLRHCQAWADHDAGIRRKPRPLSPRRRGIAERGGAIGWARAVEATYGEHGWHVHLHVLVVLDEAVVPPEQVESLVHIATLEQAVYELWQKGIARAGGTVEREPATDLRVMHGDVSEVLATYLTKAGDALSGAARALAAEATLGQFKAGRKTGNVTPFELLDRIRNVGDANDADLWREWCNATQGRKALTWSRSLRRLAGLADDELTDEEIVTEDACGEDVLLLPAETWRSIRDDVDRKCDLLEALELSGQDGAVVLLERWGLAWCALRGPITAPDHPQARGSRRPCRPESRRTNSNEVVERG